MTKTLSRVLLVISSLLVIMATLLTKASCDNEMIAANSKQSYLELDPTLEMHKYLFERHKNPISNTIPVQAKLKAFKKVKSMLRNNKDRIKGIQWVNRGPDNVGGRTRALMIDPNVEDGSKVWVASSHGGIWFNEQIQNPNSSWQNVNDFMASLIVTSLAYDPNNTQIFYAGTGLLSSKADINQGQGIFASDDGGLTWEPIPSTIPSGPNSPFAYIQDIKVLDSGAILVSCKSNNNSPSGVLKSMDGGLTWINISPPEVRFSAGNQIFIGEDKTIYISFGIYDNATLYKTADEGNSWEEITPDESSTKIMFAIAPSTSVESTSTVMYALGQAQDFRKIKFFKKSQDGGKNWVDLKIPVHFNTSCYESEYDFTRDQAFHNVAIAVAPNNPDFVILGGINLHYSSDGENFEQFTQWVEFNDCSHPYVHADQLGIQFSKQPGEVFFINDGGLYYAPDIFNDISRIEPRIKDYVTSLFHSGDLSKEENSNFMLAGSQDNGTQQFFNPEVNSTYEITGGDGGFCFIDKNKDTRFITSYIFNNYYFFNNGFLEQEFSFYTGKFINPAVYDDEHQILLTSNGLNSFRLFGFAGQNEEKEIDLGDAEITCMTLSPFESEQMVVGTNDGGIYIIHDILGTPFSEKIDQNNINAYTSCITFGQSKSELLVTTTSYGTTHIWHTTNGGNSWLAKDDNLPDMPVNWAVFNPKNSNEILIATEFGVWSTDSLYGITPNWQPTNAGLANVRCTMLKYREADNTAMVSTYGRGIYTSSTFSTNTRNISDWMSLGGSGVWHNDNNWYAGIPTSEQDIVLDHIAVSGAYTIRAQEDAEIGNLHFVDSNITLVLEEDVTLNYKTITGYGNIVLKNGASLVPLENSPGTNEGQYTIIRKKPENQPIEYYNSWASPVKISNSNMLPGNLGLRSFRLGASSIPSHLIYTTGPMIRNRGYLASNVTSANFYGEPNTGFITQSIINDAKFGGGQFNLLGNPYPSAIATDIFIQTNRDKLASGSVYIWNQKEPNDTLNIPSNFTAINYAGASDIGIQETALTHSLPSAQGFGVSAELRTRVEFNNSQRNGNNSGFKSDRVLQNKESIWLTLKQNERQQSVLICFATNASESEDYYFDALGYSTTRDLHFATLINDQPYIINSLPSEPYEIVVPLQINTPTLEESVIQVEATKEFNSFREVYVRDNFTNTLHRISLGTPFNFTPTVSDQLNKNQFELVFRNLISSVEQHKSQWYSWTSNAPGVLVITSYKEEDNRYKIYTPEGKKVSDGTINGSYSINIHLPQGIYILKIKGQSEPIIVR